MLRGPDGRTVGRSGSWKSSVGEFSWSAVEGEEGLSRGRSPCFVISSGARIILSRSPFLEKFFTLEKFLTFLKSWIRVCPLERGDRITLRRILRCSGREQKPGKWPSSPGKDTNQTTQRPPLALPKGTVRAERPSRSTGRKKPTKGPGQPSPASHGRQEAQ